MPIENKGVERLSMKKVLSGNEAIARGAWEAGVLFASAYPGTPSSEILENIAQYKEVKAEWATNEKDALMAAAGASMVGARAMASMKHVGVNVAADPLMSLSYTGVNGGLVLVTADDPELHSSQNEQDNRHYARFAKVPMLEPSDSQEAKDFTQIAFEISERFDTPVMLRSVTRISHSKGVVELGERKELKRPLELKRDVAKYVMLPVYGRQRHRFVEERLSKLKEFAETFPENRMEINDVSVGIITGGISYQYAKEVFPNYSYLKLGMTWPLPEQLIGAFTNKVKKVYVIEELDPFLEENIRAMGFRVDVGKDTVPLCGELSPTIVAKALVPGYQEPEPIYTNPIPLRPPNLCPGCPHRAVFYALKKLKIFVHGDIGCYTLGALPPLSNLDTTICMGSSIGITEGASQALGEKALGKMVCVLGDSTFLHSGVTPLMNMIYNRSNATVIILDNWVTAMTGAQEHPGTGYTAKGEATFAVDYGELATALGVRPENVRKVNPYHIEEFEQVVQEETNKNETSVIIITDSPCALLRRAIQSYNEPLFVDEEVCTGCRRCLQLGCPAISWDTSKAGEYQTADGKVKKRKGASVINEQLCNGCGLCYQVCQFGAISGKQAEVPFGFQLHKEGPAS
jgi:indolepyruvate ferredoxin oxidoreductase alpha subunit